jgi:hypothetical protein
MGFTPPPDCGGADVGCAKIGVGHPLIRSFGDHTKGRFHGLRRVSDLFCRTTDFTGTVSPSHGITHSRKELAVFPFCFSGGTCGNTADTGGSYSNDEGPQVGGVFVHEGVIELLDPVRIGGTHVSVILHRKGMTQPIF